MGKGGTLLPSFYAKAGNPEIQAAKKHPYPPQCMNFKMIVNQLYSQRRLNEFSKGLKQEIDFRIAANSDSYAFVTGVLHQPYKDVGFFKL